jgi:hypothetical protein
MTIKKCLIFSALHMALLPARGFAGSMLDDTVKGQPKDVVEFINRMIACNYWPGEMPDDADSGEAQESGRPQMIKKELKKAKCSLIIKDEKHLRSKYKNRKAVLDALEQSKSLSPGD